MKTKGLFFLGVFIAALMIACEGSTNKGITESPFSKRIQEATTISQAQILDSGRDPVLTVTSVTVRESTIIMPTLTISTPTAQVLNEKEVYIQNRIEETATLETPTPSADEGCIDNEFAEQFKEETEAISRDCPISNILPYGGPPDNQPFAIYPPTNPDKTILVEVNSTVDFEAALQWIRDQGYYPESLGCEIVFKVSNFSQ